MDGYFELFLETGSLAFYMMSKQERARSASGGVARTTGEETSRS